MNELVRHVTLVPWADGLLVATCTYGGHALGLLHNMLSSLFCEYSQLNHFFDIFASWFMGKQ